MSVATYTPTTSSDLEEIWRKVQTKLMQGMKFMAEEWENLEDLKKFDVAWSSREILVPLDLQEGYGVASIAEGGYEARPSTPEANELSLSWVLFNKRFTHTLTSHWIEQRSPRAQAENNLKYMGAKAIQALGTNFADYHYGYSTGYLATTTTVATATSGQAYTLATGYGDSTVTSAAFIADKFKVGDAVALVRSAALVTNGIGVITARSLTTPSITVTWNGSVTTVSGDYVVKANSLANTLLADTDYNRGLVGKLDMLKTASVHGLSSSTNANWAAGYADTSGGRLTGMRIRKAVQDIGNAGGGKVDRMDIDQGVERDMIGQQLAAVRYADTSSMELDGSVKYGGIKFNATERVPPGYAIPYVSKSVRRMQLLPKPEQGPAWGMGEKIQDRSAYVFSLDFPLAQVCLNRGNMGYFSGLTSA